MLCKKASCLFKNLADTLPVRVKGRKSLRNGMWHGVRNGIKTIYAGNKLTEERNQRILFSRGEGKRRKEFAEWYVA